MTSIRDIFIQDEGFETWYGHLTEIGDPPFPVTLPSPAELPDTLRYLEIPEEDINDVIRLMPTPDDEPELWWILQRTVYSLVLRMGEVEGPPRFGVLRDISDPAYRFFFVHVFVAALPHVQIYFAQRGVPEAVAQATLADLGRNVRVHRKRTGQGGLGVAWWLMLHFRGLIYQFGRLHFERALLGERAAEAVDELLPGARPVSHVLSIHIPDFCGPMTPEACDASIAEARRFFATCFPEETVVAGVCNSWLLDPQLKDYLRPESNIVQFQDRFRLVSGGYNVNNSIIQFVFGRTLADLDDLPQRSTLERAVTSHIRSGKEWEGRFGWFPW